MYHHYRSGKLLFVLMIIVGLSALLGGCVGIKERFGPPGVAGRLTPLGGGWHQSPVGQQLRSRPRPRSKGGLA